MDDEEQHDCRHGEEMHETRALVAAEQGSQFLQLDGLPHGEARGDDDDAGQQHAGIERLLRRIVAGEIIAAQPAVYDTLLADMSDDDFRGEMTGFDGKKTSRGAFIVSLVLGGSAAYRTQLFLYLKACGREELSTMNLWQGVDPPPPSA